MSENPAGEQKIEEPKTNDSGPSLATLRGQIDTLEKAQRESNQTVRTACTMVLGVSLLLVGWNSFRTFWSDEEKKSLRKELGEIISAQTSSAKASLESNIVSKFFMAQVALDNRVIEITNQIQGLWTQQLSVSKNVLSMSAKSMERQGDVCLQESNYLDATVSYTVAVSWFLKLGAEPSVHDLLEKLIKKCIPNMRNEHLEMPSRTHELKVTTLTHLSNLLSELESADQNQRYTLKIAELQSAIKQCKSRR